MDYHIYVHNVTEGGEGNPTKPKPPEKPSPTKPKKPKTKTPVPKELSGVGIAAGIIAAVKLAEKAAELYDSFASTATGDYRMTMALRNYKQAISAMTNPVGAVIGLARTEHQTAIFNRKAELQRELLGDSMISERTKKV